MVGLLSLAALAQTPAPQPDRMLSSARSWALQYARTLPDFFCDEFIRRYWMDTDVQIDTLTVQLGFSQQKPMYRLVARNNRPTQQTIESLNGAFSSGEFGSALFLAFDSASAAVFQPEPPERIRRRRVAVYSFAVPHASSRYRLQYGTQDTVVAYHGRVYIDPESGRVLRLTMDVDPPPDFPIQKTSTILDYDWRDIGGTQYLLPVRADVRTVERIQQPGRPLEGLSRAPLRERLMRYHNIVEFRDYHKYAIESKLAFDK
jgi:hypothetical protein